MEKQVPVDIVQFDACTGMQEREGGGEESYIWIFDPFGNGQPVQRLQNWGNICSWNSFWSQDEHLHSGSFIAGDLFD